MVSALLYDPVRIRVLATKTAAAIHWLDGRTCDEPVAEGSIATLRRISHTLSTTWMPYFSQLLGDSSMLTWDAAGSESGGAGVRSFGFAGAGRPLSTADQAEVDDVVELAARAAAGDVSAIVDLGSVLADHADDSAFLASVAQALGPDGVTTLVLALSTNPSIRLGVSSPALLDARQAIVEALMPYQSGVLTDPNYTLEGNVLQALPAGLTPELNPGCVNQGDAAPAGGGYVVGPDGRNYPIVIGAEPPGAGDWQVVCYQSGVERFQEAPSGTDPFWAFWAGTTGLFRVPPPNEALHFIVMAPGAVPYLSETPWTPGPIDPIRSTGTPIPADSSAASVIPGTLSLVINAGEGVSFAAGFDHQRQRAYQVVFEEDSQGHRRARIETYTLTYGDGGDPVIVPENVFVDPEGVLMSQDITYPPEAAPAGANVWPQAFDQDREIDPTPIAEATMP